MTSHHEAVKISEMIGKRARRRVLSNLLIAMIVMMRVFFKTSSAFLDSIAILGIPKFNPVLSSLAPSEKKVVAIVIVVVIAIVIVLVIAIVTVNSNRNSNHKRNGNSSCNCISTSTSNSNSNSSSNSSRNSHSIKIVKSKSNSTR